MTRQGINQAMLSSCNIFGCLLWWLHLLAWRNQIPIPLLSIYAFQHLFGHFFFVVNVLLPFFVLFWIVYVDCRAIESQHACLETV